MTTTFKVLKYDCASCALVMEGICEDTPGVKKAEVNVRQKTLTVEHDDSVQSAALKTALDSEGYPVELV
ncbi:MAG: heavy-metal-associated domain-containing protein [Candidatus Kerfeldbacteria bacterium]|nr:heavy-metal-associated domain-containing protein [Candidatus Kerfeldbacteria bacterium]